MGFFCSIHTDVLKILFDKSTRLTHSIFSLVLYGCLIKIFRMISVISFLIVILAAESLNSKLILWK